MSDKKWRLRCHLVTKQSFWHFLNQTLNQKLLLQKLLSFYLRILHKKLKFTVILSQSSHFVTFQTTGCPKKRGISESCSVCPTDQLIMDLEFSHVIHLNNRIHMFLPSTEPFLCDITEPKHRFFKYTIFYQLLASTQLSSIITILQAHKSIVINGTHVDLWKYKN